MAPQVQQFSDDEESFYGSTNGQAWQGKVQKAMGSTHFPLVLFFIVGVSVTMGWTGGYMYSQSAIDASDINGSPRHGVFDAPQFEQVVMERIQPVFSSSYYSQTELSGHVQHAIKHLKSMAESDLAPAQARELKNAKLTSQNWTDLQAMTHGARNPEVKEAGKTVLDVLQDNLFSSEEVIAQRLTEALKPKAQDLMKLRSKIVPAHLDRALGAWARNQKDESQTHTAWKGMLDSPQALQPLRDSKSLTHAPAARRLAIGIGGVPVGILSVILVALGEILVHVEMFVPGFVMPNWIWKLILTPVEVSSVLACTNGANAFCDTIIGFMGLNALDALFVTMCNVKMFGDAIAADCAKEIGATSMQADMVDALGKASGAGKIFKADPPL
jgi:hypothetical protein